MNGELTKLQARVDFLEAQFQRLDHMLVQFGFDNGLKTLAATLNEVMEIDQILGNE